MLQIPISIYNFINYRNNSFYSYIYIPKGKFNTIEYLKGKFIIKFPNETDEILNATEKVLEEKGINIPL